MDRSDYESLFARAGRLRALALGDLMLDEYLWGKAERISPEAPVQVVDVGRQDVRPGGAGNVAANLAALGCQVAIAGVVGDDDSGHSLQKIFAEKKIALDGLVVDPSRPTGKKTRVVAAHQQIVRIDRESRAAISEACESRLIAQIESLAPSCHAILASDYLKGVLTPRVLAAAITAGRRQGIPVIVDPKGADYLRYRGATILTPNRREAEAASGIAIVDGASLAAAAERILDQADLTALLITRSEEGMSLFFRQGEPIHIPTVAREVFDVTGAGDTVVAALGLALAAGCSTGDAARLANIAAGVAVSKLGTATVSPDEILRELDAEHPDCSTKIKNLDAMAAIVARERSRGRRVVFTNGCFDLLHVGHVKYLQKARRLGDMLILGLNSDASIRRLKGPDRPLIAEQERAHLLAALDCVDYVVLFDDDKPLKLLETLRPDVLAKGADYSHEGVVGYEIVEAYGGRVERVELVEGKSTTSIIGTILERFGNRQPNGNG